MNRLGGRGAAASRMQRACSRRSIKGEEGPNIQVGFTQALQAAGHSRSREPSALCEMCFSISFPPCRVAGWARANHASNVQDTILGDPVRLPEARALGSCDWVLSGLSYCEGPGSWKFDLPARVMAKEICKLQIAIEPLNRRVVSSLGRVQGRWNIKSLQALHGISAILRTRRM